MTAVLLLFGILEEITRLALKFPADRIQRIDPDSLRFARLEDGKVGIGNVNPLRQFLQADFSVRHHAVQSEYDRHATPSSPIRPAGLCHGGTGLRESR